MRWLQCILHHSLISLSSSDVCHIPRFDSINYASVSISSPLPLSYPTKIKSPPVGLPGQGVQTFFWLLKHKVKLFSQDLTPSSASPGARVGGRRSFLCVPSLGSTRDGTPSPLPWGPGQQTLSWDLLHSLISEDAWVQR